MIINRVDLADSSFEVSEMEAADRNVITHGLLAKEDELLSGEKSKLPPKVNLASPR